MDDSEDELSDAPILLADKQGQPADEEKGGKKKEDRGGKSASSKENEDSEGPTACCKKVFLCCSSYLQQDKKISRNVRLFLALVLGQFLSLLLCGTGVTSQLLVSRHSITTPTSQTFLTYVFLGAIFGVAVAVRSDFLTILRYNWWKYAILGVIDMEANFLVVLAYRYTNLTTVQLLDSFTIASVMVLSFIFLRARYKIINFMGVSLSLVGILSLVLADIQGSRAGRGTNPLLGDLLCLAGSLLYAISNVAQEFLVKNHSVVEYLGLIGISGSIASAIQLLVLERSDLVRIEWNYEIVLLFLGFGGFQFLFYSVVPLLLKLTSAVVFNLSLLTADIYTLLFGLYLFHYEFSFFYVLSFILIITGVFIYNLRQPSTAKKKTKEPSERELKRKRRGRRRDRRRGDEGVDETEDEAEKSGPAVSNLRRALFESQTYEMSTSRRKTPASSRSTPSPSFLGNLASKLISKLPRRASEADHSALESGSRKHMRTFEDLAEDEKDQGFFHASKKGLIRGERLSSGSEGGTQALYGSVDRPSPEGQSNSLPKPKRRTSRASSSPPSQGTK